MKMHDYNKDKDRVFLLIHPMMSDGAGLKLCITDHMGSDFRYLLPDLAAHGNICHDCSFVHLTRLDSEMQRNTIFAYGEKEFDLKNSRKVCAARYPEAQLKVWKGLNHCQRISGDSEAYAEMLRKIIEE